MSNTNVGESVIESYLKHIKGCIICYTNWTNGKTFEKDKDLETIYEELYKNNPDVNKYFTSRGVQRTLKSLINETEIDVIGFDKDKVYIADVAFHSNGLGYSDNEERVFKKLFRFCLVSLHYFSEYKTIEIIFASPFVRKNDLKGLDENIDNIKNLFNKFFNEKEKKLDVKHIVNEKFRDEIISPLIDNQNNQRVLDSEFFLRSVLLIKQNYKLDPLEEIIGIEETNNVPKIIFEPNEDKFLKLLLEKKIVTRKWVFEDETEDFMDEWNAETLISNIENLKPEEQIGRIKANIRSSSKYRKDYDSELESIMVSVKNDDKEPLA